MKKILAIICLSLAFKANSCLNIFAVDSTGRVHFLEHYFFSDIEFRQDAIANKIKNLEKEFKGNKYSYQGISDYGAYLLMAGYFKEGLDVFRALTKKYPDVYEIRANAAVAYELNGNIDSALYWERLSMGSRPYAHNHSEWIHLKILEARSKVVSDPDWCLTNNITGVVDSIKKHYKPELHEGDGWIFKRFIDQLSERLPFSYAEDKVLGKLLLELGDAYQVASIYRAYYCYALAKYFYPTLSSIVDAKMQTINSRYPKGSTTVEGQTVTLNSGRRNGREMLPPNDDEVNRFIKRIVNRPNIKNRKIQPLPIEKLIEKI